jgi:hypothetical protein
MAAPAKAGKFTFYRAASQELAAKRPVRHYEALWRGGLPPFDCKAVANPKYCGVPDNTGSLNSGLLRNPTGASPLTTKATRRYAEGRARNRRPTTSSTSQPSRNVIAQSKAKSLRMKGSHSIEPRMDRVGISVQLLVNAMKRLSGWGIGFT